MSPNQARKPVVSIVDDDSAVRDSLSDLLDSAGWEPRTFGDGLAFMRSEALQPSDVVITDIQMSGLDGLELIDQMRAQLTHAVPIIVITARMDDETKTDVLKRGCFAFMRKPLDPSALIGSIEKALKSARH
jgi:FixJ family two-component response regulator